MNLTHIADDDGPAAGIDVPHHPGTAFNSNVFDERGRVPVRGDDGLFRMREGLRPPEADPAVTVAPGVIEGSNVNPIEAMVAMIANGRSFEMQMKSITTADTNAQSANKLLAYG